MLPLANIPILEYILDGFEGAGVARAHVVVGHCAHPIRDHFARRPYGLRPRFIEQPVPNGTGSAALLGQDLLDDEPFLLAFGDIIVSQANYARLVEAYRGGAWDTMLTVRQVADPCHGAAVYVEGQRVTRLVEKPKPGTSSTNLDNAGIFIFPPAIFGFLEKLSVSPRGEYELTDAISAIIGQGMRVGAHVVEGFWFNLTDPEALVAANAAVIRALGSAVLSDASRCTVHWPVAIDRGCRLGRCELGPETSIGEQCVLEEGCTVAQSLLMQGSSVGPDADVQYAVLGPGARVNPGAKVIGQPDQVVVLNPA
jgi:NDP-sugar pyrophosphorylase family protein